MTTAGIFSFTVCAPSSTSVTDDVALNGVAWTRTVRAELSNDVIVPLIGIVDRLLAHDDQARLFRLQRLEVSMEAVPARRSPPRMPRSAPWRCVQRWFHRTPARPIDGHNPRCLAGLLQTDRLLDGNLVERIQHRTFILASSTPDPSGLTRILTLKSTTRFDNGTSSFMIPHPDGHFGSAGGKRQKAAPLACAQRFLCCAARKTSGSARAPTDRRRLCYWHNGPQRTDNPTAC